MEDEEEEWLVMVKKKGSVVVCLGSTCFHVFRFMSDFGEKIVKTTDNFGKAHAGFSFEALFSVFALPFAIVFFAISLWLKSRWLAWRITKLNLLTAFKPNQDGDLENALTGTDLYQQAAYDVTKFAFISWASVYALVFFLLLFFDLSKALGFFSDMLKFIFSVIMAFTFATSFVMNLKIMRSTARRRTKMIEP